MRTLPYEDLIFIKKYFEVASIVETYQQSFTDIEKHFCLRLLLKLLGESLMGHFFLHSL